LAYAVALAFVFGYAFTMRGVLRAALKKQGAKRIVFDAIDIVLALLPDETLRVYLVALLEAEREYARTTQQIVDYPTVRLLRPVILDVIAEADETDTRYLMVDGRPVSRRSRAARGLALWLDGLQGPLRPSEVGSPFAFGRRPYFSDEGHQEHVHIGYGTLPP
jgi:hypothetical protein